MQTDLSTSYFGGIQKFYFEWTWMSWFSVETSFLSSYFLNSFRLSLTCSIFFFFSGHTHVSTVWIFHLTPHILCCMKSCWQLLKKLAPLDLNEGVQTLLVFLWLMMSPFLSTIIWSWFPMFLFLKTKQKSRLTKAVHEELPPSYDLTFMLSSSVSNGLLVCMQ